MQLVTPPETVATSSPLLARVLPEGLMPPVQALTTGFVREAGTFGVSAPDRVEPPLMAFAANDVTVASDMPSAAVLLPATEGSLLSADALAAVTAGMQAGANTGDKTAAARIAAGMLPTITSGGAMQSRQGVRIGEVGMMLTYEDSSELTEVPDLYYLPNAPVWMLGLANLHGNLVPVFDLAAYLGAEKEMHGSSAIQARGDGEAMLLVLGHGAEAAGVIIDGIPQRLAPLEQQQTDTDTVPPLLQPHIRNAYFIDRQLWFDLDCASLLDALEQTMMMQA